MNRKQSRNRRGRRARGQWSGHPSDSLQFLESDLATDGPRKPDHKTQQLCRQVERALSMALAGECDDDALRELIVDSVVAMGSASQLLVRVVVPSSVDVPATDIMERLKLATPMLRHIVAGAICRKRVPTLSFVCVPPAALEGGADA